MRSQLELVADCPACRVEGALVEVYDPAVPACALGVAAESRCRLCEALWEASVREGPGAQGISSRASGRCPGCASALQDDEVEAHACGRCGTRAAMTPVRAGHDLRDLATLHARLAALATEDREPDLARYLDANFMGRSLDELHAMIARGDAVETTFDAMFSLFQRGAGRAVNASAQRAARPPSAHAPRPSPPSPATAHDPRAMLLALVSVLVADGHTDPRETAFVDGFLRREGMAPLAEGEWVVHRPVEVAGRIPPARRAEVVEMMTQLACVDGHADPSELRVVESYAAAWGIPREDLDDWVERYRHQYASDVQRFVQRLKSFFVRPHEAPQETPT